jgi:hypothetical protein
MNGAGWSARQVKRNDRDDHSRMASQGASKPTRGAIVQRPMPAVLDDELGQDDGQSELGSLDRQRVDVARQRRDDRNDGSLIS